MVTRTRLSVTLYVQYIACLVIKSVTVFTMCVGERGAAGVAEQSDHCQCLELRQDTASHDVISENYATP
jgi:hypothetical protein